MYIYLGLIEGKWSYPNTTFAVPVKIVPFISSYLLPTKVIILSNLQIMIPQQKSRNNPSLKYAKFGGHRGQIKSFCEIAEP